MGGPVVGEDEPTHLRATVRRLTAIEVERLQGFPDDWTKYRMDGDRLIEQADSSRYKQMGNAVTVNVVEWIMGRLVQCDPSMTPTPQDFNAKEQS
jgi:DNA (cytosine-5)-methyltransferase 1